MNFTELIDLAAARVGGKAIAANDEFFAAKSNLLKAEKPVFIEDKYTPQGKWMDGWESRRRREAGHDWCLVKLGLRGVIRGFDVDTSFFTGNYPEFCSIDAADVRGNPTTAALLKDHASWTNILPKSPLKGGSQNLFPCRSLGTWTHIRLNIFPDGGVARLRVHGDVIPDWDKLKSSAKLVDLAAVENGATAIAQSDMYFGRATNMLMPGRAKNMGDGWETKRRRGPGHDWLILKLGAAGTLRRIEVDTNHFKGNYPDSCMIEGVHLPGAATDQLAGESTQWVSVLPQTKLSPSKRHLFQKQVIPQGPITHVRLNIYPDGGVSRLRLFGQRA